MADTDSKNNSEIKKSKKGIRKKHKKIKLPIIIAASAGVVAAVVLAVYFLFLRDGVRNVSQGLAPGATPVPIENIIEDIPEGMIDDGILGTGVLEHIVGAGRAVENAYNSRPATIPLTDENTSNFVNIDECVVEGGTVNVTGSSTGIPKSDDKYYYLFALDTYTDALPEDAEYVSKAYKNDASTLTCSLNYNSSSSKLFKKFAFAVKVDGKYILVSQPKYITNPENICRYSNVYMEPSSKKGILIDYTKYKSGQLQDLGVKQVALNFRIADFLGPTSNALFPTIHYSYDGKTYTFNGAMLSGFDETVKYLSDNGITVTAILLNSYSGSNISLIHPDSRNPGVCPYYMFNAADNDGVEYLAAVGSFFAERYSGSSHGRISNFVIANEINARKEWNYMAYTDVDSYTKEYAKGFRVLYNAIKSVSGSARVYISLDQQWDRNMSKNPDYDGRDVLDCFNSYLKAEGNIDWGLAFHPYNVPLTTCATWSSSKYIKHTADSPMISMANIEVLINYLKQDNYLDTSGNTRSIYITELGYTSSGSGGESYQAAAIAYAFYKINHYPEIDGLLLNRQTDDATEIAQGLATGITTLGGGTKKSYDVFKYMDTSEFESHAEFAKSIIGISNWSQIMR